MNADPQPGGPAAGEASRLDAVRSRPSLFRRLIGTAEDLGGDAPIATPPDLELELAERLDTVLGIAERLAASHDRQALFRTIVDETRRALRVDYVTIRVIEDDRLVVAAWAGLSDAVARCTADLRGRRQLVGRGAPHRTDRRVGGRPGRGLAPGPGPVRRYRRVRRGPGRAAPAWRPGDRRALGRDPRTARLDRRGYRLPHDARDPRGDRAHERGAVRADRSPGRAAGRPPGRIGPALAGVDRRGVGRTVVEETRQIIDYHNARVYLSSRRDVVPIAFEGRVGAYERVDFGLLRDSSARGSRVGSPSTASRCSSTTRTATRAARPSRAPTTSTSRCSSCRCATTRRRSASSRSRSSAWTVRRRRPAPARDPRRPGRHRGRVGAAADPHARISPASSAACST